MATPSFVQVPPDSTGKKVDACQVDVSGTLVERQRMQVAGDASGAIAPVTATDGLSVNTAVNNPVVATASDTSVAAGGSTDLDSTQIASGLTGKLLSVVVSSSVPFKIEVKRVQNASVLNTVLTSISSAGKWEHNFINKKFVTVAHDVTVGFDGFRVTVTNLDTSEAAAIYTSFFYDEE